MCLRTDPLAIATEETQGLAAPLYSPVHGAVCRCRLCSPHAQIRVLPAHIGQSRCLPALSGFTKSNMIGYRLRVERDGDRVRLITRWLRLDEALSLDSRSDASKPQ